MLRILQVTTGLISKRRSFLEDEKWKTSNWPEDSSSNQQQSRLTNILVFVPGFLEDKVKLDRDWSVADRNDLVDRIQIQLAELFNWRWQWDETNQNAVYERARADQHGVHPAPVKTTLHFLSISQASEILLYNAVLAWIMELICKSALRNSWPQELRFWY